MNTRVYAFFVRLGEECSNLQQEIVADTYEAAVSVFKDFLELFLESIESDS